MLLSVLSNSFIYTLLLLKSFHFNWLRISEVVLWATTVEEFFLQGKQETTAPIGHIILIFFNDFVKRNSSSSIYILPAPLAFAHSYRGRHSFSGVFLFL